MLALSAICLIQPVSARLRIIDREYDFGLMKEAAGPKTGTARFVNDGREEIVITQVKPSCGCTSAEYPEEPIAPGDTAVVSFTYDPFMRPGRFEKTVKVYDSDGGRHVIHINGNVLGTPESLETMYPLDAGSVKLSESILNMGNITMGKAKTLFITGYTLSMDSISPTFTSPAKSVKIAASAPKSGPGDLTTYTVTFDPRLQPEYGPMEIPLTFTASEADSPVDVKLRAFVIPDTALAERMMKGKTPACAIWPDPVELGELNGSDVIETSFTVANDGKAPLTLLRVYSESPAVTVVSAPGKVKPGKTAKVKLSVDSSLLPDGPFRIPVGIVSDDPLHPDLTTPLTGIKI